MVTLYAILFASSIPLAYGYGNNLKPFSSKPKVFADVNFNRFSRENDGLLGLWSYNGIAEESQAKIKEFNFNGDFISSSLFHEGLTQHTNLATENNPKIGLTSDLDTDYLKYLILQSILIGIDGFIVEWGYEGHQSDVVLSKLLKILKISKMERKFTIGISWCDNWTKMHLGKNASTSQVAKYFYDNAMYLLKTLYIGASEFAFTHENNPVILLFGGGLNVQEFKEFTSLPLIIDHRVIKPIWIGNYLNTGSSDILREKWSHLINGTFAWVTHARDAQKSGSKFIENFDTYTIPEDSLKYQTKVANWAQSKITSGDWTMFLSSVNPGEDNRPCAGWGQTLKFVPRYWNQSYNFLKQWRYMSEKKPSNYLLIATLNDYSESTVILPSMENGFRDLYTTAKYTAKFKKDTDEKLVTKNGLKYPYYWFKYTKEVERLTKTGQVDVKYIKTLLDQVWERLNYEKNPNLDGLFRKIRISISKAKSSLKWVPLNVSVPSSSIYPVGPNLNNLSNTFLVNSTHPLRLKMNESLARSLRNHFYRGMISFAYEPSNDFSTILKILGSSDRNMGLNFTYYRMNSEHNVMGDYGIVGEISCTSSERGTSKLASLELIPSNLNWKHNLKDSSDLVFQIFCAKKETECHVIISEIELYFYILI